jgi:UDP-glucuronate 4-epimerase
MNILVTGAAGFIGFHLVSRLLKEGHSVVGLDSLNDYYDVNLKYARLQVHGIRQEQLKPGLLTTSSTVPTYRFVHLPLEDREALLQLFATEQFDAVVNLAAQAGVRYSITNPYAYVDANVVGFMHVLEGCRQQRVGHLVYASTSSVYGLNEDIPFSPERPADHPISLYAATKKANEMMAHVYSHLYGVPTTGLRFFTVYGPWGRPDMAIFLFTKAILEGKPINLFNNGDLQRDFTYIDDIVEGVARVLANPAKPDSYWNPAHATSNSSSAPYRIYNIGNNAPVQLMDFIEAIEKKLGRQARKNLLPLQPGDVKATYADVGSLVRDFDYQPKTSIEEGVGAFIDWYLEYYNIKLG